MRFTPYDDVMVQSSVVSSVGIQSLTGSSAVNGDGIDTALVFDADTAMFRLRAEIASGTPTTATVAWKIQESNDNGSTDAYADATDNTGTVIGATINVKTVAADAYARLEGLMLRNNSASAAPYGGRKRWLRVVLTPAFSGGSSPAILAFAELIGAPGPGAVLPVRTAVSNT
jgi:hypothetical protein